MPPLRTRCCEPPRRRDETDPMRNQPLTRPPGRRGRAEHGTLAPRAAPPDLSPARGAAEIGKRRHVAGELDVGVDDCPAAHAYAGHDAAHDADERVFFN